MFRVSFKYCHLLETFSGEPLIGFVEKKNLPITSNLILLQMRRELSFQFNFLRHRLIAQDTKTVASQVSIKDIVEKEI